MALLHFAKQLENVLAELVDCCFNEDSAEIATVITGYIAK